MKVKEFSIKKSSFEIITVSSEIILKFRPVNNILALDGNFKIFNFFYILFINRKLLMELHHLFLKWD